MPLNPSVEGLEPQPTWLTLFRSVAPLCSGSAPFYCQTFPGAWLCHGLQTTTWSLGCSCEMLFRGLFCNIVSFPVAKMTRAPFGVSQGGLP